MTYIVTLSVAVFEAATWVCI